MNAMDFKTYEVKQGQYGGIIDSSITIPDNLKLITSDDSGHVIDCDSEELGQLPLPEGRGLTLP
jgi:hypothetical protein